MKKKNRINVLVVLCLTIICVSSTKGQQNYIEVENQPVNYSTLTVFPEVFLVKVVEVNEEYLYCRCILNGKEIYVEPLRTENPEDTTSFERIEPEKYYLMALALYWEISKLFPFNYADFNMGVETINGYETFVQIKERLPKPFVALNMNGYFIRPITSNDLARLSKPVKFIFHPGVPSLNNWESMGVIH